MRTVNCLPLCAEISVRLSVKTSTVGFLACGRLRRSLAVVFGERRKHLLVFALEFVGHEIPSVGEVAFDRRLESAM